METEATSLMKVYDGWKKHQLVLIQTITPLTPEQLAYRPAPHLNSMGELLSHMSLARLWWFYKMAAPGSVELARQIPHWEGEKLNTENPTELSKWSDATQQQEEAITENLPELIHWLEATWQMIEATLTQWSVADLAETYRHFYEGKTYTVSRWWTIWRVMSHDLHHGGQVALALGIQGIEVPDLWWWGGQLIELPLAEVGG
jgi:uncharacterized damage-inducible protein DinB